MNNDLLFHNGEILTMDSERPSVEAVLLRCEKIIALGSFDDLLKLAAPGFETIDLDGKCLMPGFHDSHVHLLYHGLSLAQLNLENTNTVDEALALLSVKTKELPNGAWIQGSGFLMSRWGINELHKRDLDRVAPNHPVILRSQDHHSAWVNSLALKLAGIDNNTPDPEHGEIVRNSKGEATGLLLEHAHDLVQEKLPKLSDADLIIALNNAAKDLAAKGITTVHHMAYEPAQFWRNLAKRASQNDYPLRVWACIDQDRIEHAQEIGLATGQGGDNFTIGGVKFFADGALGSKTAYMLEPYPNTNEYGTEVHAYDYLIERYQKAIEAGLIPVTHAIGDAANRAVLDALEKTKELWQAKDMRPRVEHAQHLHEQDVPRFAELGVIASVQPLHLRFDAKTAISLIGEAAEKMHLWRSLTDNGVKLALGSDTPVASPNVLEAMKTGLDRKGENGKSLNREQALTIDELLAGYTKNAAFAIGRENRSGMIKAGFDADFVILSHNPKEGLGGLRVVATMKAGSWTFRAG